MPLLRRYLELRKIIKTEEALKDLSRYWVLFSFMSDYGFMYWK